MVKKEGNMEAATGRLRVHGVKQRSMQVGWKGCWGGYVWRRKKHLGESAVVEESSVSSDRIYIDHAASHPI